MKMNDPFKASMIATLLENQKQMNENPVDKSGQIKFDMLRIPLIKRTFPLFFEETFIASYEPIKPEKKYRSIDDPWEES